MNKTERFVNQKTDNVQKISIYSVGWGNVVGVSAIILLFIIIFPHPLQIFNGYKNMENLWV